MLIIGEKLNSSIPQTLEALKNRAKEYITNLIKLQARCGADFLDINTALTSENEIDDMLWVAKLVSEHSDCGIMLDSSDPNVIMQCAPKIKSRSVIVNSITLEDKYNVLIDLIRQNKTAVVCLPIKDNAIPQTATQRLDNAKELVRKLHSAGIRDDKIFIDVLVGTIASNENAAVTALETVKLIKENLSGVNTICGVSNISFGLPMRAKLNSAFFSMCLYNGLDSAIVDITSEHIQDSLYASKALLGIDKHCLDYINYIRNVKE